ncbi:MAG: surface-adhesin E family protein [Ignavibacteria bacterium]
MKSYLFLLLNFIFISHGISQTEQSRWKILVFTSDYAIFYDIKTIELKNNTQVWLKWIPWEDSYEEVIEKLKANAYDEEKYDDFSHRLQYWEVDCRKKRYSIIEYVDYSRDGNIIKSYNFENPKWNNALPETIGEQIILEICKLLQDKK